MADLKATLPGSWDSKAEGEPWGVYTFTQDGLFEFKYHQGSLEPIPIGSRGGSVTGCRCPNGIGS
jgi:hypothetical protein